MKNYCTVQDIVRSTGRSRHTIHYHLKQKKLGTIISGVVFLNKKEEKIILKAIADKKEHYDKAIKTRKKNDKSRNSK